MFDDPGGLVDMPDPEPPPPPKPLVPGIVDLTIPQAVELAFIHNRQYQFLIEEVYLAALDVAFERFQFNIRFLGFGGREPGFDLFYTSVPQSLPIDAPNEGENNLEFSGRFGITKLFPTGAQFIIELTNNTIWLFAGPNQTETASTLSYSLVQPLLRNAGRKVVLESLTQAERNLLYAIRNLARFRKFLFVNTVGGGGGGVPGGNLSGGSGGFLGLLQQRQFIDNQIDNIRRTEEQLETQIQLAQQPPPVLTEVLPVFPEGVEIPPELAGVVRYDEARGLLIIEPEITPEQVTRLLALSDDPAFQSAVNEIAQLLAIEVRTLQILQLQSQVLGRRQRLRELQQSYRDSLDRFKIELGLPPDFQISISEELREPFILIGELLVELEQTLRQFVRRDEWLRLDPDDPQLDLLRGNSRLLVDLLETVRERGIALVADDIGRLEAILPTRRARMTADEREQFDAAVERDRRIFARLRTDIAQLARDLDALQARLAQDDLPLEARQQALQDLAVYREALLRFVRALQGIQVGVRAELIQLNLYTIGLDESVAIALRNRLDLMNQRAIVMDARRKIELAANDLRAVLDVVTEGDVRTPPLAINNHPFNFQGDRSEFRVGLRFTAPLDQINERNAYRATLIEYQRTRRDYLVFEDQVKFSVRAAWRDLAVLERNFEIARQNLRIAALQYDSAVEATTDPRQQAAGSGGRDSSLSLLQALNTLLNAQNGLISTFVNYERSRLNIYRDMGIMEIDARGIWIDEFYLELADQCPPTGSTSPRLLPDGPDTDSNPGQRPDGQIHESAPPDAERLHSRLFPGAPPGGPPPLEALDAGAAGGGLGVCRPVGAFAPRPLGGAADRVPQPGDRSGQAGPVPHHGDGAWRPRQLQKLDPGERR